MQILKIIQRNIIFRIFSSVKLAIPLLLIIAIAVCYGTIVESRFNAEVAKIQVYETRWFHFLLYLLGLNIFIAMLSRFPWKKRHLGFVLTHIGMTTLLVGSWITYKWGIDGQMQVQEGSRSNSVMLSEKIVEFSSEQNFKKALLQKSVTVKTADDLSRLNEDLSAPFKVTKYYPFIDLDKYMSNRFSEGVKIDLGLKSQFFDQNISLHTVDNNELKMGPALFKIVSVNEFNQITKSKKKTQNTKVQNSESIKVFNASTGKLIQQMSLKNLMASSVTVNGVEIELVNTFTRATVDGKSISNEGTKVNPAVELKLKKSGKTVKEILFSRFPTFSVNDSPAFNLKLEYISANGQPSQMAAKGDSSSNVIQVAILDEVKKQIGVKLLKDGKVVLKKEMSSDEIVTTPWMGMEILFKGLESIEQQEAQVVSVDPPKKSDNLPPGAIEIQFEDQSDWVVEGQVKSYEINGQSYNVYFGKNQISLPFFVGLQKFYKKTYPGTSNAMSFESDVLVNGIGQTIKISMNEPLKSEGYTLYQASYVERPNQPSISVFSVNKDPGRAVKYIGSIILALGVIIYTYMKSSFYRNRGRKVEAS